MLVNSNRVAIVKFKNGLVPFQGVAACFVFLEECLGAEESNIQVWEIVVFILKQGDAALIVNNLVSNGSFFLASNCPAISSMAKRMGIFFKEPGMKSFKSGLTTFEHPESMISSK